MLEFKSRNQPDFGDPLINAIRFQWMAPGEVRSYELYVFQDHDYTYPEVYSDSSFSDSDALGLQSLNFDRGTDGLRSAKINITALDSNAQAILDGGHLLIRADTLSTDANDTVEYEAFDEVTRTFSSSITRTDGISGNYSPASSPLFVGDIPPGRPVDRTSVDTEGQFLLDLTKALRLDIQLTNPGTQDLVGPALFAIDVVTANQAGITDGYPIYDVLVADTGTFDAPPQVDRKFANVISTALVEAQMFDTDLQTEFNNMGFVF